MSDETVTPLSENEKFFIQAAVNGDAQGVCDLLGKGVAVDVRDSESYPLGYVWNVTALMCAASNGHTETVRVLLQAGASVSAAVDGHKEDGGGGSQALHYAMAGGHAAVGAVLLDGGADPNVIGRSGRTPLALAILGVHLDAIRLLLNRGANINLKTPRKDYVPSMYAAAFAVGQTSEMVSENGKLVLAASRVWAKKLDIFELFKLLLEAGADPNALAETKDSPLQRLVIGSEMPDDIRIPLMESLLKAGAKPDAANKFGSTPLSVAVSYSIPPAVKVLCKAGADVNRPTIRGTQLKIAEEMVASVRKDIATPFRGDMKPERVAEIRAGEHRKLERTLEVVEVLRQFGGSLTVSAQTGIPPPSVPVPASSKSKSKSEVPKQVLGATHFLKFIYDGEPEWSVFAVKADIESVTEAFSKLHKAKKCNRRVEIKPARRVDELARLISVVHVKGSPWTLIYWSLFFANEATVSGVVASAKKLSAKLKTESISSAANDKSDVIVCEQFKNGKDDGVQEFEDHEEISKFFEARGVYLPACYPKSKGKDVWLAVEKASADSIERADLIGL